MTRHVAMVALLLLTGCFRPTPCTQDAECGGPGGKCDLRLSFCVTVDEPDAAIDGGALDAGGDAGADGGEDGGPVDAGAVDAGPAPTVTATTPLPMEKNVPIEVNLTATFSDPMDASTISPVTFTLQQGTGRVDGGVTFDAVTNIATFAPAAQLETNRVYAATITTGARSVGGVPLETSQTWTFTTALIALRSAQTYSVLGAAVSNSGQTTLSGDLGVSTAAPVMGGTFITVGGATHAGNAEATRARTDLLVAYNAARALAPGATIATLDGRTLTAGVYSSNSVAVSLSTMLTLDGEGDPNAVFVFQVDAALNTGATTSNVTLIRGARASNVFWQVSGAVTLGASSRFAGTILGLGAITVGAGAVIEGRVLTVNGDVTLAANTISD